MLRAAAIELLAPVHAQVLQLADAGLDGVEIAARLGIDDAAVDPLLQIARAKLAALEELDDSEVARRRA